MAGQRGDGDVVNVEEVVGGHARLEREDVQIATRPAARRRHGLVVRVVEEAKARPGADKRDDKMATRSVD